MSPRWFDKRTGDHLALDTGGGPLARLWTTALAGLVDTPYVKATGKSVKINLPKTAPLARDRARVEGPAVGEHARAQPGAHVLHRLRGGDGAVLRGAGAERACTAATSKVFQDFEVPDEAIGCGFHEAVRGVLSHHLVIRDGKIANYHPYPPTPWNASPRDTYGTPGPYEDAVQGMPIFEENGPENFKGIDIMRTVRSFDPCLPCGVHMYLGDGKVIEQRHSPMFGAGGHDEEEKYETKVIANVRVGKPDVQTVDAEPRPGGVPRQSPACRRAPQGIEGGGPTSRRIRRARPASARDHDVSTHGCPALPP